MSLSIRHSGIDKTLGTKNVSVVTQAWRSEYSKGQEVLGGVTEPNAKKELILLSVNCNIALK